MSNPLTPTPFTPLLCGPPRWGEGGLCRATQPHCVALHTRKNIAPQHSNICKKVSNINVVFILKIAYFIFTSPSVVEHFIKHLLWYWALRREGSNHF